MLLPHEVLGVSVDADLSTIKRAFRTLAKQWHPDRNRDPVASARFRSLVSAYCHIIRDRVQSTHIHAPRSWSEARASQASRPATATASVDWGDDGSWVEGAPVGMTAAYPVRLARIVVLGTLGTLALFWISALVSQL